MRFASIKYQARLVLIAVVLFLVFQLSHPFLRPIQIVLTNPQAEIGPVIVQWDSGSGFNVVEQTELIGAAKNVKVILPHYSIRAIRFTRVSNLGALNLEFTLSVCSNQTCKALPYAVEQKDIESMTLTIQDADRVEFRFTLATIQFLFAVFIVAMFSYCIPRISRIFKKEASGANECVPFGIDPFFFIFSFVITFCSSILWLLAWWPGAMTYLSVHNWIITNTLEFDYWNPWYYQIWLTALCQIIDSPATIAVVQICLLSSLVSFTLAGTIRSGGSKLAACLAVVIYAVSPPIVAWSTILWFDIPYEILVVACAVAFFSLYFQKRYYQRLWIPSTSSTFLIIFLFLSLVLIRRNGLVFLPLVPAVLMIFNLLPRKKCWQILVISLSFYGAIKYQLEPMMNIDAHTARYIHPRVLSDVQWKMNPLFALFVNPEGYVSDDYEADKKIIEKLLPLNFIHGYYSPKTVETTLWKTSRVLSDQDIEAINSLYYRRIWSNLDIIMRDRSIMFLNNLNNFIFATTLPRDNNRISSINWECRNLRFYSKLPMLNVMLSEYLKFLSAHKLAHFVLLTPIVGMILLMLTLLAYKWLPATALYSFIILFQVPFLFLTLPGAESRYFSFIFIGGLFLVPFALLEIRTRERGNL